MYYQDPYSLVACWHTMAEQRSHEPRGNSPPGEKEKGAHHKGYNDNIAAYQKVIANHMSLPGTEATETRPGKDSMPGWFNWQGDDRARR